ncbi:MAG: hypothetical protein FWE62_04775 [Firmicutes bacterium]|nr:hypothetical protein [Bacillota bacterium]
MYKTWLETDNGRAYKAKQMRYKKSALAMLQLEDITDELYTIQTECDEIQYFMSDDETLTAALDDNDEEAYEFRMLFMDLSAKANRLDEILREEYVTEHFDDFLVGALGDRFNLIGFDGYEEDYYGLTAFEQGLAQTESGKRITRLTKDQMLTVCGQCLGIVISFIDIRHKYDYLKSSFDILKNQNNSILQTIKAIEELYEKAVEKDPKDENVRLFDSYLASLPDDVWVSA